MKIKAYAKINPYLNITGRREDGYHELDIIFRPVSLYDELEIEAVPGGGGVELSCDREELCADNIIFKAYDVLKSVIPGLPGFRVSLKKNIPSGAGLGGGSADAAAFLRGANELAGPGLDRDRLFAVAARVGADVPACLLASDCRGSGAGEVLEPLSFAGRTYYILIKPPVSFFTPEMYRRYDEMISSQTASSGFGADAAVSFPAPDELISALAAGDVRRAASLTANVFEYAVPERGLITGLKQLLLSHGADGACMTGSGSCVVGYFADRAARDAALAALKSSADTAFGTLFIPCEDIRKE